MESKRCIGCGAPLPDNVNYCLVCGTLQREEILVPVRAGKSKKPALIATVIAAALLVAAGVTAFCLWQGTPFGQMTDPGDPAGLSSPVVSSTVTVEGSMTVTAAPTQSAATTFATGQTTTFATGQTTTFATGQTTASRTTTGRKTSGKQPTTRATASDKAAANDPKPTNSTSQAAATASSVKSATTRPTQAPVWETQEVPGGVEIGGIRTKVASGQYVIPAAIDGKPVVGIGEKAFYYETSLKSVTLPDTITYLADGAFLHADNLQQIVIPANVRSIGVNALMCDKLADVYIASVDVDIDNNAFSTMYHRSVDLTIHAPAALGLTEISVKAMWDAVYVEWNG